MGEEEKGISSHLWERRRLLASAARCQDHFEIIIIVAACWRVSSFDGRLLVS